MRESKVSSGENATLEQYLNRCSLMGFGRIDLNKFEMIGFKIDPPMIKKWEIAYRDRTIPRDLEQLFIKLRRSRYQKRPYRVNEEAIVNYLNLNGYT